MSYNLHIHRKRNYHEDGPAISAQEWESLCRADPSMEYRGEVAEIEGQGGAKIQMRTEGSAVWRNDVYPAGQWFVLNRGEIVCQVTDNPITPKKACEIAGKLNARVQGDDGEFHLSDGTTLSEKKANAGGSFLGRLFGARKE
jgi:hypothetical protein